MYTDQQLQQAFNLKNGKRVYRATYYGVGYENIQFAADSKPEAKKIAREYGVRFINKKLHWVYLVTKKEQA
jgi:hypothetical protein